MRLIPICGNILLAQLTQRLIFFPDQRVSWMEFCGARLEHGNIYHYSCLVLPQIIVMLHLPSIPFSTLSNPTLCTSLPTLSAALSLLDIGIICMYAFEQLSSSVRQRRPNFHYNFCFAILATHFMDSKLLQYLPLEHRLWRDPFVSIWFTIAMPFYI